MAICRRPTDVAEEESPQAVGCRQTTTALTEPLPHTVQSDACCAGEKLFEMVEFLAPVPEAVPAARRHVTSVLDERGLGALSETAALLTCELVSNAVKHGSAGDAGAKRERAQQIVLTVRHEEALLIEVWDPGSKGLHPRLHRAAPHDEVGRGLHLVDTLSSAWGHYAPAYGGRAVWCELPSHCGESDSDGETEAPGTADREGRLAPR
jgi:anti-sigma regulatory factor (Ser/Thr protein kinase)